MSLLENGRFTMVEVSITNALLRSARPSRPQISIELHHLYNSGIFTVTPCKEDHPSRDWPLVGVSKSTSICEIRIQFRDKKSTGRRSLAHRQIRAFESSIFPRTIIINGKDCVPDMMTEHRKQIQNNLFTFRRLLCSAVLWAIRAVSSMVCLKEIIRILFANL
jgi:hypothetical protein